jgi:hypothetical protein
VEGATGPGALLARQVVTAGEQVVDVPSTLTVRVRLLGLRGVGHRQTVWRKFVADARHIWSPSRKPGTGTRTLPASATWRRKKADFRVNRVGGFSV